ncbi:CDP-glucose 4,6-dehydratase [Noviherbaspirillum denitrificans]|uniref:CDP-glucose 4,6-dehydratase n=1 Tax=Noviherbaspirillum denitrificans TaxID=1968433 RepID=A0A254TF84_9BURK|nr:CDP-glucose 4,6-dehydratase [Noviherbaspirillum denitrificans]OWW21306.1 CDP-glucose 4,6-dehydratase [Noviherbaspirillum denitrificans]
MTALPSPAFWHSKRVVLTGHTGFKGSWLALWLKRLGAEVRGIALPPDTSPALFKLAGVADEVDSHFCDIRDPAVGTLIREFQPDIVLHLAAQPLVRAGYRQPLDTFSTNVMGTAHVLDALRGLDCVKVALVVTTDKVYLNREWPYPYREDDTLGGHDPYSASKAASEMVARCYRDAYLAQQGVALATARAGNVIGGGDWSADRLIPDAARAWDAGASLSIRSPNATRPWQHVLEPLAGYLVLAEHLWADASFSGAWNFGPASNDTATVRTVVDMARATLGHGDVIWGDNTDGPHEAGCLALETAKARQQLNLLPRWTLQEAVGRTMRWYRSLSEGADAKALCEADIRDYEAPA